MTSLLLYPKNRPLKNLISDFKKQYPNTNGNIVVSWDYGNDRPIPKELNDKELLLYNAVVEYWYFSEIGFDEDLQFIYRFNAIWNSEKDRYIKLLELEEKAGVNGEFRNIDFVIKRDGNDSESKNGESIIEQSKTGQDTMQKGVTTTSEQSTENKGDKLNRSTPNETLTVKGDNTTTVTDSGEDKNIYDSKNTTIERPNIVNNKEYNSSTNNKGLETKGTATPEAYRLIVRLKSIYKEFALCFEKIFMEVF